MWHDKATAGRTYALETPTEPWAHVAMNFVSGFENYLEHSIKVLVVVCIFSKMVTQDFCVTDRDPLFVRKVWTQHMLSKKVKHRLAAVGHPKWDGLSERVVKEEEKRSTAL